MEYVRPYDPATKAPSLTANWQNEDVENNQEGSIPPAEFFHAVGQEIVNAITSSGLVPNDADLAQLWNAIRRSHTILTDTVLYVPGEFDTLQDALDSISDKSIPAGVIVTIQMAAGDHIQDITTGPTLFNYPYGQRLRILGAELNAPGFPVRTDVDVAAATTAESVVRARFPTRIVCNGVDGIVVQGGQLGLIQNIAFIGNGTNINAIQIGDWVSNSYAGVVRMEYCWAHNFGIAAAFKAWSAGSLLTGRNWGISHSRQGIRAANAGFIHCRENFICVRSEGAAIIARDNGGVEIIGGGEISNSGTAAHEEDVPITAIGVRTNGHLLLRNVVLRNHTVQAMHVNNAGQVLMRECQFVGNTLDVNARNGSMVISWEPIGTVTSSPANNTEGNNNSFVRVYNSV